MRARAAKDGVTLRVIAGTHSVILAMDLEDSVRAKCLGFSIERTDLVTGERRWLPNMIKFASDTNPGRTTTARAPLQTFRWGDYTVDPGHRYSYRVIARRGEPADIIAEGVEAERPGGADRISGGVSVEVRTEDPARTETAVFFNRGAAASNAYNEKFGNTDPAKNPVALVWLSRGLEEALLSFLAQAKGAGFGLHAAIYEFQKPNLLEALRAAKERGVDVQVVYHARQKTAAEHKEDQEERRRARASNEDNEAATGDHTLHDNLEAIRAVGLDKALGDAALKPRKNNPQGAIMHDKYVVLLKDGAPVAVWTGSTNWTDGALYGQLNVGHAVYDAKTAGLYERSFELLKRDPSAKDSRTGNEAIMAAPASLDDIPHGVTAIFSPQSSLKMIDLYAKICAGAKLLFVSAPFLLHENILKVLNTSTKGALRYVMADKSGSFGAKGAIDLFNGDPGRVGVAATVLHSSLHDFQGKLLEGKESFHHAGVHIHSKIILADPFGADPILVTGSANFSKGSTMVNDSNSLIVRGDTAVADIYATEFMRMFEHYWFRFKQSGSPDAGGGAASDVLFLNEEDKWQDPYFDENNTLCRDRVAFVG